MDRSRSAMPVEEEEVKLLNFDTPLPCLFMFHEIIYCTINLMILLIFGVNRLEIRNKKLIFHIFC